MHKDDLLVLKEILSHTVDPIQVITSYTGSNIIVYSTNDFFPDDFVYPLCQTAGLHPTAEQIEMFAYHLPDSTLSNLVVSTFI